MGERCGLLIKNEIREFKKDYSLKHPHKARWWWKEFFNNFIVLICWTKKVQERRGLDQSFTQPGCSKKCKGMTFRDFYADVEGTVKEFGYEPEKLLKFFRKARKPLPWFLYFLENYYIKRWLKISIPLYIRLREKGYNYYDLTK